VTSAAAAAVLRPEETEAIKYAFISEDDDMGTIGSTKSYLMMSESDVVAAAAAADAASSHAAPASGKLEPGTSGNISSSISNSSINNNHHHNNNNMSSPAGNVHHNAIYLSSPSSSSSSSPRVQHMPAQQSLVSHPLILSAASANSSPTGSLPFLSLEPPLSEEDYNFALEASEGIADLFDEDLLLTSS
jgi:hypothetical protein